SGAFAFSGLAAGAYGLTASRNGYWEGAYGRFRPNGPPMGLQLADGERRADVRIRVWKWGVIAGTVTDDAGEPIVGVRVRAMRSAFLAGRRRLVTETSATTDDRGMYRIGGLLPGEYIIAVPSVQTTVPAEIAAALEDPGQGGAAARSAMGAAGLGARPLPSAVQVGAFVVQGSTPDLNPGSGSASMNGRMWVYPTTYNGDGTTARQAPVITIGSGDARTGVDVHLHVTPAWRV